MGIKEKLIQLAETKNLIKNAIIDKGVEITPETPFREYADKIAEISGGGQEVEYIKNCHIKLGDEQRSKNYASLIQGELGIPQTSTEQSYSYNDNLSFIAHNTECSFLKTAKKWKINIHFLTGNNLNMNNTGQDRCILSVGNLDNATFYDSYTRMGFRIRGIGFTANSGITCLAVSFDINLNTGYWVNISSGAELNENSEYIISIEYDESSGYDITITDTEVGIVYQRHNDEKRKPIMTTDDRLGLRLSCGSISKNEGERTKNINYKLFDCYIDQYNDDKQFIKRHAFLTPKSEATENFRVVGILNNDNGIYSGFRQNNASIADVWSNNCKPVILRTKFKVNNFGFQQCVLHCEPTINAEITSSGMMQSWNFSKATSFNIGQLQTNTWYYLSIKFVQLNTNEVRKYFYLSTTGFNESSAIGYMDDKTSNDTLRCRFGCSSYSLDNHFDGSIDMRESCVVNHNGEIVRQYYLK